METSTNNDNVWIPNDPQQSAEAKKSLDIWPLDEYNAKLLNEVHPRNYIRSTLEPHVRSFEDWILGVK